MIFPQNPIKFSSRRRPFSSPGAFTLIELITVIAIIAILMGLLLPAVQTVRNQANKAKAKSDVMNIVTAVKGFYTDYGQYPPLGSGSTAGVSPTADSIIGPGNTYPNNNVLMDVLRAVNTSVNTRAISYLDAPNVKIASSPKGGIATVAATGIAIGDYVDPWGLDYFIAIDYNYNNIIDPTATLPWSDVASGSLRFGAISWSSGVKGTQTGTLSASGAVVSFQ